MDIVVFQQSVDSLPCGGRSLPPVPVFDSVHTATLLREWFAKVGFTVAGVRAHLGLPEGSKLDFRQTPVWWHRTRQGHAIDLLIRCFLLGKVLPVDGTEKAFESSPWAILAGTGLLAKDASDKWVPTVRFYPSEIGWLCADLPPTQAVGMAADYVMGVAASTETLIHITSRRPVRRFLDLGCGCGIHALLAARHATEVYAVDLNPRAVAFTRFNAALNGLGSVDARVGDRFEPFEGLHFDQIVSNPPFVVSPSKSLVFRDSGQPSDTFFRSLVRDSVRHLAPGGVAQFLGNWVVPVGRAWVDASRAWLDDLPAHVWVLCSDLHALDEYASFWIVHTEAGLTASMEDRLEEWVTPLASAGIGQIAAGSIQICRTENQHPWRRFDNVPRMRGSVGETIRRRFDMAEQLLGMAPEDWMTQCLRLQEAVRLRQVCRNEGAGWTTMDQEVVIENGFEVRLPVDSVRAAFLSRCDGRVSLAELIREFAEALGEPEIEISCLMLPWLTELVAVGVLELGEIHP